MRKERDSMGEMEVPDDALYGASTQRAVLNFPISSLRFPRGFIKALGIIKKSAATANRALGLLPEDKFKAISEACSEVIEGTHDRHFVVDIFQTGSGTSTNMNANEVIANRAIEIMGGEYGDRSLVHPNDHVNMSQSSNDVIPSAIHISAVCDVMALLVPALEKLAASLDAKSQEFSSVVKSGRTHLQDATPITLGQEFSGYCTQIRKGIKRVLGAVESMKELALGGTAVGTGLNTHPKFPQLAIKEISKESGIEFREAENHFEAQGAKDACVELSGQLRVVACSMLKIADDIRWLGAGPRCNLAEIRLPEVQPGSSIMPGKVNPVICESVMMVAAQVIGNDTCVLLCGERGNLELNTMMPVMAYNLLQSIEILSNAARNFAERCIDGIQADKERCREYAEKSLATCTSLAPVIGYDKAAEVAKKAYKSGRSIREVMLEEKILEEDKLRELLDPLSMTKPNV